MTSGWLWGAAALVGVVPAAAFHDGGVATCSGCHVMHEGASGPAVAGLLIDNASDLCLSCHADAQGEVLGVDPLLPPPERGGGNFVFLLEDNLNDGPDGGTSPIPGEAGGHNVVAPGNGLAADSRYATAPGGSFPAAQMGCTSCHDPHGRAEFRLLNGAGPVQEDVATFLFPAPQAVGIALDGAPESEDHHTAYVAGMSDWCANCHGHYHETGGGGFEHPVDGILDVAAVDQYNVYDGDDDPTGGTFLTAYIPQVPFEDAGAATGSRTGATATSRLTCLSCHRAHATSAPAAGRWDFDVALLADDGAVSGSWPIPQPYGAGQGTLCTKCHEGGPP